MTAALEEGRVPAPRVPVGVPEIVSHYENAQRLIESARAIALKPGTQKRLDRKLTLGEVCKLLGIHHNQLYGVEGLPAGEKSGSSRLFTVPEFHEIMDRFGLTPQKLYAIERAVTVAFANFKGGVGKTSEAVGFAEDSALRGNRTLVVDCDPQGSATSLLGKRPYADVDDHETLLPFIYGQARVLALQQEDREAGRISADQESYWTGTLRSAIQPTYWPRLDLLPANLSLGYADIMMGLRDKTEPDFCWYRMIQSALDTVATNYDVIVLDLPPTLSLYTGSAIYAADALVIPSPANQMDLESTLAFLRMLRELLVLAEKQSSVPKVFDAFRILVTKYQSNILSQSRLFNWISTTFGASMVPYPMPLLPVIQNLGPELQTIYEHAPRARHEAKSNAGESFRASKAQIRDALAESDKVHRVLFDDVIDIHKERQAKKLTGTMTLPTAEQEQAA